MTARAEDHAGVGSADPAPVVFARPRRVVFDTNVLLSLFVFTESRLRPLRKALESGRWQALSNAACLAEFRRVLGYPQFALDTAGQEAAYAAWLALVELDETPAPPGRLPRCADADDQKFLELALASHADWLISADKAVLRLARRRKLQGAFAIRAPQAALAELLAAGG